MSESHQSAFAPSIWRIASPAIATYPSNRKTRSVLTLWSRIQGALSRRKTLLHEGRDQCFLILSIPQGYSMGIVFFETLYSSLTRNSSFLRDPRDVEVDQSDMSHLGLKLEKRVGLEVTKATPMLKRISQSNLCSVPWSRHTRLCFPRVPVFVEKDWPVRNKGRPPRIRHPLRSYDVGYVIPLD